MLRRKIAPCCLLLLSVSLISQAEEGIYTTNSLYLQRPELRCKGGIHYQPVNLHLKFFDFDAGLMLYTESGKIKRPQPLILFFAFNRPIKKFAGKRYSLNHSQIVKPILVDKNSLSVTVKNGISEDVLKFLNMDNRLVFTHSSQLLKNSGSLPKQEGVVFRLPKWIWDGGSWSLGNKSGKFHQNVINSDRKAYKLPVEVSSGTSLILTLPKNRGKLIIKASSQYEAVYYLDCSGNLGMFFDLFFVRHSPVAKKLPRDIAKGQDRFEITFAGKVVPDIWETFSMARKEYDNLKSQRLLSHPGFGAHGNSKLVELLKKYQCMTKNNCFYGAIFKNSNTANSNYWLDIPIQTRNFLVNLVRLWHSQGTSYYNDSSSFARITAALDYLSTATTPFGQYGDVRLPGWTITPFLWGIMPVAESIYDIQDKVSPERRKNWLAMLNNLYKSAKQHLKTDIDTHHGDGANLLTYAQQVFDLAMVLNDDNGKSLTQRGVHCAIEPAFHPQFGVRKDWSYRQGNLFDVGYYQWLLSTLASYVSVSDGTRWALGKEEMGWLKHICGSFVWLYDNGLLNTMTSHPKNRLSRKPFPKVIANKMNSEVSGVGTISTQSYRWLQLKTNAEKEKFVSGNDCKLPMGIHWFSKARYFIQRTHKYYASIWWNSRVRVRDFRCNGNYNAKIPCGAMFLRWLDKQREVTIPSNNIDYSDIVYLKDMAEVKDWGAGFENYKGSELIGPVLGGDYTILAGKVIVRSGTYPERKVQYLQTVILNNDEVVAFETLKPTKYWKSVIFQPAVLRNYTDIPQKILLNNQAIKMNSCKGTKGYLVAKSFTLTSATTLFRFTSKNLLGHIKLSNRLIDGSQRYSLYPPAKVIRIQFTPNSGVGSTLVTRWCSQGDEKGRGNMKSLSSGNAHLIAGKGKLVGVIYRPCNISEAVKINQQGQHYYISLKGFSHIFVIFYQPVMGFSLKVDADNPVILSRHRNYVVIQSDAPDALIPRKIDKSYSSR